MPKCVMRGRACLQSLPPTDTSAVPGRLTGSPAGSMPVAACASTPLSAPKGRRTAAIFGVFSAPLEHTALNTGE